MKTPAELRAALSARSLPGGDASWLDLVEQIARERGAHLDDVLAGRHLREAVRTRTRVWGALRGAGYTAREIAEVWGVQVSNLWAKTAEMAERLGLAKGGSRGRAEDDRAASA